MSSMFILRAARVFYVICIDCVVAQAGCAAAGMCGKGVSWEGSKCDHRVNRKYDIAICAVVFDFCENVRHDEAELILLASFMRKNYHFDWWKTILVEAYTVHVCYRNIEK